MNPDGQDTGSNLKYSWHKPCILVNPPEAECYSGTSGVEGRSKVSRGLFEASVARPSVRTERGQYFSLANGARAVAS